LIIAETPFGFSKHTNTQTNTDTHTGTATAVAIPSQIQGQAVTEIGIDARYQAYFTPPPKIRYNNPKG